MVGPIEVSEETVNVVRVQGLDASSSFMPFLHIGNLRRRLHRGGHASDTTGCVWSSTGWSAGA